MIRCEQCQCSTDKLFLSTMFGRHISLWKTTVFSKSYTDRTPFLYLCRWCRKGEMNYRLLFLSLFYPVLIKSNSPVEGICLLLILFCESYRLLILFGIYNMVYHIFVNNNSSIAGGVCLFWILSYGFLSFLDRGASWLHGWPLIKNVENCNSLNEPHP